MSVVGCGASRGCPPEELAALVDAAIAGLSPVTALATVDVKADEPAIVLLASERGWPLELHPAERLARVAVPTPSATVLKHVGTPSVAEAAALASAGTGARLLVTKQRSAHATVAVAQ